MNNKEYVLGIDPGSKITGYAVISSTRKAIDWGVIKPPNTDIKERIFIIGEEIENLIKTYKPLTLAIESQYLGRTSCIKISQLKGVIIYIAQKLNLKIVECHPLQIKRNCSHNGKASKETVMKYISAFFNIPISNLNADSADALAIAMYYLDRNVHD